MTHDTSQGIPARSMWSLINVPQDIDPGAMRLSCTVFFVVYAIIVFTRAGDSHWQFTLVRCGVCLYALLGIWLARRPTGRTVRAYTVGVAFVLPLTAAYVDGMMGNGIGEVALSALATFVPLVFLQTAVDFILIDIGLVVGHALVLSIVPEPVLSRFAISALLGGALATGTVAGLQALIYRVRWAASVADLEKALASTAEWKNRFEAASLASGQLLYDWDPRADEVRFGGAYERILGYALAELAGGLAGWHALIHPDDLPAFEAESDQVLQSKEPFRRQYRLRRKDQRFIIVEDNGYFVLAPDGEIVRLVGFVSDVTERVNAESARADEAAISAALAHVGKELLSSLETPVLLDRLCRLTTEVLGCDFSHTWIWHGDEGVYVPVSGYGFTTEEWEALGFLRIPSNPETPMMARLLRNEVAQVTPTSTDYPIIASVLAHYGFSIVLCAPLFRDGKLVGIQSAGCRMRVEPFTAAQERIARGIAHLASMAWTNAQLVEELERASRLKSEFVSTMSHELRTPLNVILGYTEILGDTDLDSEQALLVRRLRHSSVELLELIEATLDLNRLASGKNVPQLEAVALSVFWDELQTEFAALPAKAGVELRWGDVDGELHTDRRKLKMILKNLIGNALKFTPAGHIAIDCDRNDAGCVFTVADTGIGIPEMHLPHIFEMFRQVDNSDVRAYGGVGLGLYIVRQLVDQLSGEVAVESEPGRGSMFRVTIPDRPPAQAAAA